MDRTRIAGIVAAVGALAGAVFAASEIVVPTEVTLASALRNCLFHLAAIVGLVGLTALGAAGHRMLGKLGTGGAIIGFALLCVAEVTDVSDPAIAEVIYQICPLLIGISMILLGVAVVQERAWSGWRRFTPLVSGAYVFVVFLPLVIVVGDDPGLWIALAGWELTFLLVGVSVAIEAGRQRTAATTPVG